MLIHEICHLLFASAGDVVSETADAFKDRTAHSVFKRVFDQQLEYGIDAVADILDKLLPVISYEEKESKYFGTTLKVSVK